MSELRTEAWEEHRELLRRELPAEEFEKIDAAYREILRVKAIAEEIPGGKVLPRHRLPDALDAITHAQDALIAAERRARPSWWRRLLGAA